MDNLNKLLLALLLVAPSILAVTDPTQSLVITLEYNFGEITIGNLRIDNALYHGSKEEGGDYLLQIFSKDGEVVYNNKFRFPLITISEYEGLILQNISKKEIIMPYNEDFALIKVFDTKGNLKLDMNIGKDTGKCGDNLCQLGEDYKNCSSDCVARKIDKSYLIALIIVLTIVAVYLIFFRKLKKK